jgi:hypothetical protein
MYEKEDDPVEALIDRLQAEQHLEMMRLLTAHPQEGTAWEDAYKNCVAKQGISGGGLTLRVTGLVRERRVCITSHKTMDAYFKSYFKSEGFDTIGFEESVWVRPAGGKYSEDIYVSAHVDDCLLSCKSLAVMAEFKAHMLDRVIGTDEGEVTEYLGCELVRDQKARTGQLNQAGVCGAHTTSR